MSAVASPGRLKLGAEPKKLALLVFFVLIAIVLWIRTYADSGDAPERPPAASTEAGSAPKSLPIMEPPTAGQSQTRTRRRFQPSNDRGALQMRPIDPTHGDIDPTLRLDLLDRLTNVKMVGAGRSLFAMGTAPVAPVLARAKGPIIQPAPIPGPPPAPVAAGPPPPVPIALKFYGYIRPATVGAPKRGFFLDGDVILVASEGEILKQRYRIVSLKENKATFEDTATKIQQDVALTPEAHSEN
jgi:hypothetical protein